jgi:hypothetical protein
MVVFAVGVVVGAAVVIFKEDIKAKVKEVVDKVKEKLHVGK